MQKPTKTAWQNLVIETARTIKFLDDKLQNPFRIIAAKKLKQLHNTTHKRQLHVLKQIKPLALELDIYSSAHHLCKM